MPERQLTLPRFELKFARMSSALRTRSLPARLLPRATAYQVEGNSAPGKSLTIWVGPADPRTAVVASHWRAVKLAWIRISTGVSSRWAQISAAAWNAISRCWPIVVPGFPPTGAAGVGSLKPTRGSLALTIVILAPPARSGAERRIRSAPDTRARIL